MASGTRARWSGKEDSLTYIRKTFHYRESDLCIGRVVQNMGQPTRSRICHLTLDDNPSYTMVHTVRDGIHQWSSQNKTIKHDIVLRYPILRSVRRPTGFVMALQDGMFGGNMAERRSALVRAQLDAFLEGRELYIITEYDIIVDPVIEDNVSYIGPGQNINLPIMPVAVGHQLSNNTITEKRLVGEFVWLIEYAPITFPTARTFYIGKSHLHQVLDKANDPSSTGIILQS